MMILILLGAVCLLVIIYQLGLWQGRRAGGSQMLGSLHQQGYLRPELAVKRVEKTSELRLVLPQQE